MTEEQKQIVENNINLVRKVIWKYCPYAKWNEDAFQVGCIALMKAVKRFDKSLGFTLSTYATKFIVLEVRRYYRNINLQCQQVLNQAKSLSTLVNGFREDKPLELADLIIDEKVDVSSEVINKILYAQVFEYVEYLPPQQRLIFLMYYKDELTQVQIAKKLRINQVTVSRELKRAQKTLRNLIEMVEVA